MCVDYFYSLVSLTALSFRQVRKIKTLPYKSSIPDDRTEIQILQIMIESDFNQF